MNRVFLSPPPPILMNSLGGHVELTATPLPPTLAARRSQTRASVMFGRALENCSGIRNQYQPPGQDLRSLLSCVQETIQDAARASLPQRRSQQKFAFGKRGCWAFWGSHWTPGLLGRFAEGFPGPAVCPTKCPTKWPTSDPLSTH